MPERKAEKKLLTDRFIRSLKPRAARYCVLDTDVRGFGVRVNRNGSGTYILVLRYPGAKQPAARSLGRTDEVSLAEARDKARDARKAVARGVDPRAEAARARGSAFSVVIEDYISDLHRRGLRTASAVEKEIRKEILPCWQGKALAEISRDDVRGIVERIAARGARGQARHIFAHAVSFFSWTIGCGLIDNSPCAGLNVTSLTGPRVSRTRVLNDAEIRAFWRAALKLGFPFGDMLRLLLITGAREGEAAGITSFEITNGIWSIPATRYKSKVPHVVPLSTEARSLLSALPRFAHGPYLFSSRGGAKALASFDAAKKRLDAFMREELGAFPPFVIHDLRRTMRTRLSELKVPDHIAELSIGHARKGLQRTYDLYSFRSEIAEALEAWGTRLRGIVGSEHTYREATVFCEQLP